ncbi:hypothetical protein ABZ027_04525 [Streptomyces sp. NPDC006332]|uniref:hypothetical protein n=1 Tax=Streptomyces sp. NPDC006332 TaxID=3155456 RepID=UPI0033A376D9
MSVTSETTRTPERRSVRQAADTVLTALFRLSLMLMLALGTTVVLLQAAGLVTASAGLIEGTAETLQPILFALSAGFGVLTLLLSYTRGWKTGE